MGSLEYDVWKLLQETYLQPVYDVAKNQGRKERWLPDFEVRKGTDTLLAVEVKDIGSTRAPTFDSQVKRAFAVLALYFVRRKRPTPFLVLPDGVRVPKDYEVIFLEINYPIIRKKDIPHLKEDWDWLPNQPDVPPIQLGHIRF
jgi:hypothetical protein